MGIATPLAGIQASLRSETILSAMMVPIVVARAVQARVSPTPMGPAVSLSLGSPVCVSLPTGGVARAALEISSLKGAFPMTIQRPRPYHVRRLVMDDRGLEARLNEIHDEGYEVVSVTHVDSHPETTRDEFVVVLRIRDTRM